QVFVVLQKLPPHRRHRGARVAVGLHDQCQRSGSELRALQIKVRARSVSEVLDLAVSDHAVHHEWPDSFADWILSRPVAAHEAFIDPGQRTALLEAHLRRLDDRNTHGLKIIWPNLGKFHDDELVLLW